MPYADKLWTTAGDARLAELWATGASTRDIGALLGRSANGVIGRAHRLRLPPRASPILRKGSGTPRVVRTPPPSLPQAIAAQRRATAALAAVMPPFPPAPLPAPPVPSVRAAVAPAPRPTLIGTGPTPKLCQWPHGEPGTPGFHFCGIPSMPGRPYCPTHCAAAYKQTPRQEQAE